MAKSLRVLLVVGILLAGFAAGRLSTLPVAHAGEASAQADANLPSTQLHAMQSIHFISTPYSMYDSMQEGVGSFPEKPTTLEGVKRLPYLSRVYEETWNGTHINVVFSDAEDWYLRWLDWHENRSHHAATVYFNELQRYAGSVSDQPAPGGMAAFVLLPPPDNAGEADDLRWVVERHPNGNVKSVTPYVGDVTRGEGRIHGLMLEYNADGKLTATTPYVNGRRHGQAGQYSGRQVTRRQEATSTVEWANGRRVIQRQAPRLKTPPTRVRKSPTKKKPPTP
jgi:hypothetical protein